MQMVVNQDEDRGKDEDEDEAGEEEGEAPREGLVMRYFMAKNVGHVLAPTMQ